MCRKRRGKGWGRGCGEPTLSAGFSVQQNCLRGLGVAGVAASEQLSADLTGVPEGGG